MPLSSGSLCFFQFVQDDFLPVKESQEGNDGTGIPDFRNGKISADGTSDACADGNA